MIRAGIRQWMPRPLTVCSGSDRTKTSSSTVSSLAARWRRRYIADRSSRTPLLGRQQGPRRIPTGESEKIINVDRVGCCKFFYWRDNLAKWFAFPELCLYACTVLRLFLYSILCISMNSVTCVHCFPYNVQRLCSNILTNKDKITFVFGMSRIVCHLLEYQIIPIF